MAPNGRVFYINHAEKKTTWVDPRSGRPSQLPSANNVPNRRHEDDLGPLPEGWEERVHTDGRIFFIDHNTRATQVKQIILNFDAYISNLKYSLLLTFLRFCIINYKYCFSGKILEYRIQLLLDQQSPIAETTKESSNS